MPVFGHDVSEKAKVRSALKLFVDCPGVFLDGAVAGKEPLVGRAALVLCRPEDDGKEPYSPEQKRH